MAYSYEVERKSSKYIWRTQLPVTYLDTTLVINTWETVSANLSRGQPAKVWYVHVEQTNNGAGAENIELEITINGTPYLFTLNAMASGAVWCCYMDRSQLAGDFYSRAAAGMNLTFNGASLSSSQTMPFTAASVGLIRARQTTAVDVGGAQIEVNLIWDRKEAV